MSSASHIEMHHDHKNWRLDDAFWREEVAGWEHEINQAITELPQVEQALRDQAKLLMQDAAAIRLYEQDFATHEHALAEYEQGEAPPELIELAKAHSRESEQHAERRQAHEKVKKQQHMLMAKWGLLFRALVKVSNGQHGDLSQASQARPEATAETLVAAED